MTTKVCAGLCDCDEDLCAHCEDHLEMAQAGITPVCLKGECPNSPDHITETDWDKSRWCPTCLWSSHDA